MKYLLILILLLPSVTLARGAPTPNNFFDHSLPAVRPDAPVIEPVLGAVETPVICQMPKLSLWQKIKAVFHDDRN